MKAQLAKIRESILSEINASGDLNDRELYSIIDRILEERAGRDMLDLGTRIGLRTELYNSFKKLDILQELIDNRTVTEIMINGPDEIYIERGNRMERWHGSFESEEKLEDIIQQIVSGINRRVNTASPIADARLSDGSRVHIVLPPVALNGPTLTIRKFPEPIGMERMISSGTIPEEAAEYLGELVRCGYNIFISGGTSSGKSTFLNALTAFVPQDERVITIEDSAELQIRHIGNLVRLETRDANADGQGAITMAMLIKASLRMRPDRIIVGEVRGAEALDMLTACNTGHDGSLSTGHANSTGDMLTRLESMVLMAAELPLAAIRSQIAAGIDILVHLARLPDRSRRVMEITEVKGIDGKGEILLNPVFQYDTGQNKLVRCGSLVHKEKLILRGSGRQAEL
ncbi:MAG: CpaF family protein [Lachnospiraceae bacterium]|nr:CpaF family protein [Lachnospiraceae bacterium]